MKTGHSLAALALFGALVVLAADLFVSVGPPVDVNGSVAIAPRQITEPRVEFAETQQWVDALAGGREVVFEGVRRSRPEGVSEVVDIGVQSLGPLNSQSTNAMNTILDKGMKSAEMCMEEPVPATSEPVLAHSAYAMRVAEAAVVRVRFGAMKCMMNDKSYLTVLSNTGFPTPSGYSKTVYHSFCRESAKGVMDVVFLVSLDKTTGYRDAMECYNAAVRQHCERHCQTFNSLTESEKAAYLEEQARIRDRLQSRKLTRYERARIEGLLFPGDVEIVDGMMRLR